MSDSNNAEIPSAVGGRGDGKAYQQQTDRTSAAARFASNTSGSGVLKPVFEDAARGQWPRILQALGGIDTALLDGKHHPCPACGGKDRFRFDDKDGSGSWFCNQCGGKDSQGGAGSGIDLLMAVTRWDFKRAASKVERFLGIFSANGNGLSSGASAPTFEPIAATAPPSSDEPIRLAMLVNGPAPAGDPIQLTYHYGHGRRTRRIQEPGGEKSFRPEHAGTDGKTAKTGAGPGQWPVYEHEDAVAAAKADPGASTLETEGEKCAVIARQGGAAAISQAGHARSVKHWKATYKALKAAGVTGVVFLSDVGKPGEKYARMAEQGAAAAGLLWWQLPADVVWPELTDNQSIDDAPGSPAERILAIERALAAGLAVAGDVGTAGPTEEGGERPATYSELIAWALDAVMEGDLDTEMVCRAELKARFRSTDQQIEARLLGLYSDRRITPVQKRTPGVDLGLIKPLSYRSHGWILAGDCQTTFGPTGTGKTTLCIAKGMALAEGRPFLDREEPCQPGKSLIIATDSGAAALRKSFMDLGVDPSDHYLFAGPSQRIWIWAHAPEQGHTSWVCDIRGIVALEKFITEFNIDYVVMDSAKSISACAAWSYTDNEAVKRVIRYLREAVAQPTGCTIEIINHDGTVKGSQAGAKAWIEDPSMVVALSVVEEGGRPIGVQAEFRKDRASIHDQRRIVRYSLEDGVLELLPGTETVGNCSEAILTILQEAHQRGIKGGLSMADLVREACARFSRTEKTVRNTATTLVAERRVVKPHRGFYALSPGEIQRSETPLPINREDNGPDPSPLQESGVVPAECPGTIVGTSEADNQYPEYPDGTLAGTSNKVSHTNGFLYTGSQKVWKGVPSIPDASAEEAVLPRGGLLPASTPSPAPVTQTTRELVEAALASLGIGPDQHHLDAVNDHLASLGHHCSKTAIFQALLAIHRDEFERGQPSLNLDFPS